MNVRRWRPPLLWAGAILLLTSYPNPPIPRALAGTDKLVHFGLYAGLGYLVARSLLQHSLPGIAALGALAIALAFGGIDEWHQQFIPGRSMDLADWRADATGAAVGILAALTIHRSRRPL